jgi:hypothetical protein
MTLRRARYLLVPSTCTDLGDSRVSCEGELITHKIVLLKHGVYNTSQILERVQSSRPHWLQEENSGASERPEALKLHHWCVLEHFL